MAFKMNGKDFASMLAIAKELGKARIYRKDFDKFGIIEVDDTEVKAAPIAEPVAEVKEEPKPEVVENKEEVKDAEIGATEEAGLEKDDMLGREYPGVNEEKAPEPEKKEEEVKAEPTPEPTPEPAPEKPKREKKTEEEKKASRAERRAKRRDKKRAEREEANKPTAEMLADAEKLQKESGYTDIWDWAVDMKKKSAEEVFELAEKLGLTWERHDVERIDRMRAVMVLRENLFPGQKRPKVRRSAWKDVPNEVIAELAKKNNVEYTETADEKITRMHMIKALKDAGIESPEA
jgi:hypothetical protein